MSTWTPAVLAELVRLASGPTAKSCGFIADQLGVTKNAVVGKIHRMQLAGKLPDRQVTRDTQLAAYYQLRLENARNPVDSGNAARMRAKRARKAGATEILRLTPPTLDTDLEPSSEDFEESSEGSDETNSEALPLDAAEDVVLSIDGKPLLPIFSARCCWPLWGDDERPGRPQRFCGEPRELGHRNYCTKHADLAVAAVRRGGYPFAA